MYWYLDDSLLHCYNLRTHTQVTAFGRQLMKKFGLNSEVCSIPDKVREFLLRDDDLSTRIEMPNKSE